MTGSVTEHRTTHAPIVKSAGLLSPAPGASQGSATGRPRGAADAHRALVERVLKTRSGKIVRPPLEARELGLPGGDVSTLEGEGR